MIKIVPQNKPEEQTEKESKSEEVCLMSHFRYGQPCPACGSDQVDYNGLLNLVCKNCGLTQTGAFT
jgi:hypothetical protein